MSFRQRFELDMIHSGTEIIDTEKFRLFLDEFRDGGRGGLECTEGNPVVTFPIKELQPRRRIIWFLFTSQIAEGH